MKQTSKLAFYLERMASRSIPARQVLRGTGLTVELLDDDWSVVTASGDPAVHVEHTVAITDDGPWVLTRP